MPKMKLRSEIRNDSSGSLARALDILEALAEAGGGLSLSEIAARTRLPKPTIHRILKTLRSRGYVESDGAGVYQLGSQILRLAGRSASSLDYGARLRPVLRELVAMTHATVHFGVLRDGSVFYAEKLDPRRPYRMASTVGMEIALHSTAIGKAVLAHLPAEERASLIAPERLERRTPNTITEPRALERELAAIRDRGFAVDDEENEEEIRCVGAPVFGHDDRVVGAVSVSSPTFHLSPDDVPRLALLVVAAAREASRALGAPLDEGSDPTPSRVKEKTHGRPSPQPA